MKKLYSITLIAGLLFLFNYSLLAQTSVTDINQVELLKQFIGTWKNDTNKDTTYTAEFKPYGNGGLEFSLKGVTPGKILFEMKQLWGYDKNSNKVIIAGLMKDNPNIILQASWFKSKDRYEQVPYEFASNPEKADFLVVFEIKSPDQIVRQEYINGKSLGNEVYTRVRAE